MVCLPKEREGMELSDDELVAAAKRVIESEARELLKAASRIGYEMAKAARLICGCKGRVVVVGLGKSGHVARKIAATFSSLGTPAFFLHAAEGAHGDLGMVCREDVGLFLSNSGHTQEVLELLPFFKRLGAPVISITGDLSSPLAEASDLALDSSVEREADPLGLAPTSSTALQMAIGDALAAMVTELRGLDRDDFALFHPGGKLGRRLLLRVCDVMGRGERMPLVREDVRVCDAIYEISSKGYGATVVVDGSGALCGIFTDGDLRRLLERSGLKGLEQPLNSVMTKAPKTIAPDELAAKAVLLMEENEISVLVVVEGDRPVGIIHLHELLKAGVA
ncbi:KpsF/GutQ family sugar-phosphate isomerase [Acetomicrobium sp. S15 = DSM 107314]|jgi:arabinose-5-phosphate isomerase|uniref:KpsF/GutQ family sugar-phosphate isomerase n=1 Tax=Acetomicrobium sp. S15 = DSM 107314 TaxID=2529858 RepID=UPI0022B7AB6B|nr:KpsF/GutQ family sugar-phosphate isomerase [Acetomicrobium sp. S15 = DSM 107314]